MAIISGVRFCFEAHLSLLSFQAWTQPLTATGAPSQTSTIPYHAIPYHGPLVSFCIPTVVRLACYCTHYSGCMVLSLASALCLIVVVCRRRLGGYLRGSLLF